MEFENVIKSYGRCKSFSEYDERDWDYIDCDYERTSDYDIPYDGECWDFPNDIREWGY